MTGTINTNTLTRAELAEWARTASEEEFKKLAEIIEQAIRYEEADKNKA